jgi:antitoxin ParD1/3/4
MASLNVSMPKDLRRFVDVRAKATSHSTPTEYVRSLIREDQKRAEQEKLERLLLEGLDSGEPIDATSQDWWDKKRAEFLSKHRRKLK